MWRLGILPEAPAQEEDKVRTAARCKGTSSSRAKGVAARRKPRRASLIFTISPRDICSATFNLAIAGSSVTEFAGAFKARFRGHFRGRRDGVPQMSAVDFAQGGSIWL